MNWEGFEPDEVSVALQHYLALAGSPQASLAEIPDRLPVSKSVRLQRLLSDADYIGRIRALAEERRRCGRDSPTLLVVPGKLPPSRTRALLENRSNLALVFAAETVLFQDTVHALQLDALLGEGETSTDPCVNVLGVHREWLLPGGFAGRALVTDRDGRIKEAAFAEPVQLHYCISLHLPRETERSLHQQISRWCGDHGIKELNPCKAAAVADSKAQTHICWQTRAPDITSPAFCVLKQGTATDECRAALNEFLSLLPGDTSGLYVQPDHGTEGFHVSRVAFGANRRVSHLAEALLSEISLIHESDDAIVRQERGNVLYLCPEAVDKGCRRIICRLNVVWNGDSYVAQSGYVQVARDERECVASRGRGGEIIPLQDAFGSLYYQAADGPMRIVPTESEISYILHTACAAAAALYCGGSPGQSGGNIDRVHLLGIDLLLETYGCGESTCLRPVALEVNPRPAGLAQSGAIGPGGSHIHVCPALFRGLPLT